MSGVTVKGRDLEGIPKPVHVSQHEDTSEAAMVLKSGRPNTDPEDRQDGRRLLCLVSGFEQESHVL